MRAFRRAPPSRATIASIKALARGWGSRTEPGTGSAPANHGLQRNGRTLAQDLKAIGFFATYLCLTNDSIIRILH
jgi:hypothetical protein